MKWDEQNGLPGAIDWYATGYLNNFFLSLAEDDLQPVFQDLEKLHKIKKLEEVAAPSSPICPTLQTSLASLRAIFCSAALLDTDRGIRVSRSSRSSKGKRKRRPSPSRTQPSFAANSGQGCSRRRFSGSGEQPEEPRAEAALKSRAPKRHGSIGAGPRGFGLSEPEGSTEIGVCLCILS